MIPVLCYHRVCPKSERGQDSPSLCVSPEQFESQMGLLKLLGYTTVSVQNAAAAMERRKNLPARSVAVTFDDGYEDNYTYAFPILKKMGFMATVFLITDFIGKTNAWDSGKVRLLNEGQIREMHRNGIVFGSHTVSHLDMSKASAEQMKDELMRSKQVVDGLTSRVDTVFCYPYTRLNAQAKLLVKESGYFCAVSGDPLNLLDKNDIFEIPRVQVFPSTSLFGFWKKIQPWYPAWMRMVKEFKGK